MGAKNHFYRLDLARAYVAQCMGDDDDSDAPNGLFLAGARRTGKSEFLRNDLTEVFEEKGALVIYVDLWEDGGTVGSQALIARAIQRGLKSSLGLIEKTAKEMGVKEISRFGFKLDLSKIGDTGGMTLFEALWLLHEKSGKKIALIIDEAQHALTSDEGEKAMFALKSARDQMRIKGDAKLMLVMSGSHKDKLAKLVIGNGSPFYGSYIDEMPTLGYAFAINRVQRLLQKRPDFLSLNQEAMKLAFSHCFERPQLFDRRIKEAQKPQGDVKLFEVQMIQLASQTQQEDRLAMQARFTRLEPLQQALLVELMEKDKHFQPMAVETLKRLTQQLDAPITTREVQTAIDNLCKMERLMEPPFIWKAGRATWDIYDQSMIEWYEYLKNAGQWPPR